MDEQKAAYILSYRQTPFEAQPDNLNLPRIMSFLLVPHLPRLVGWERRTTVTDRQTSWKKTTTHNYENITVALIAINVYFRLFIVTFKLAVNGICSSSRNSTCKYILLYFCYYKNFIVTIETSNGANLSNMYVVKFIITIGIALCATYFIALCATYFIALCATYFIALCATYFNKYILTKNINDIVTGLLYNIYYAVYINTIHKRKMSSVTNVRSISKQWDDCNKVSQASSFS